MSPQRLRFLKLKVVPFTQLQKAFAKPFLDCEQNFRHYSDDLIADDVIKLTYDS